MEKIKNKYYYMCISCIFSYSYTRCNLLLIMMVPNILHNIGTMLF